MPPELKPCPFCGHAPEMLGGDAYGYCAISCQSGDCYVTVTVVRPSEAGAAVDWNRRAAEPEPPVTWEDA